jgi:hypothetical protein
MNHCSLIFFAAAVWVSIFARPADGAVSNAPAILEHNVAYLRINRVENNLTNEAIRSTAKNKVVGTVVDLRFADGDDFGAARADAAALASENLPLAILVNSQTREAAVALASELRAAQAGLVFGSATEPVSTGGENIPSVEPDIPVPATLDDERVWLKNPYATLAQDDTNSPAANKALLPFVDHTSEADLVREQRQSGGMEDAPLPAHAAAPQPPVIQDPVLARALDFIKGLAIVHHQPQL